jgi:ML domain
MVTSLSGPNGAPMPTKVTVPNCDEAPCKIVNKQSFDFTMEFVAAFPAKKLTNQVNAFVMGINTGYKLPDKSLNACSGIQCPLLGGESLGYGLSVPVQAPMTGVTVTIEYTLLADDKKVMLCFRAPAKVV